MGDNALIDENGRQSMIASLNTDGVTRVTVKGEPTLHALEIMDGTSGTDFGLDNALIDENGRFSLYAVSSADGVTRVPLYTDSSGYLLVQST